MNTQIDYSIKTLPARINRVNKIINEHEESIHRYFETVHLKQDDKIPRNRLLWQLANYILYCKKQPTYREKTQHKFEESAFPLHDDKYFFKNSVELTRDDISEEGLIREKEELIKKLKLINGNKKILRKWIRETKNDQLIVKESISPPSRPYSSSPSPYYKQEFESDEKYPLFEIISENNSFNLDLFLDESWKTVLKVLPFKNQAGERVNKLIDIFNKVYPTCNFKKNEREIIRICQKTNKGKENFNVIKNKDIAKKMNTDQITIANYIRSICSKLCKGYEEIFQDYYYTFLVKGHYKKCIKCDQVLIIQKFYINKSTSDGHQNICKDCVKKAYKS